MNDASRSSSRTEGPDNVQQGGASIDSRLEEWWQQLKAVNQSDANESVDIPLTQVQRMVNLLDIVIAECTAPLLNMEIQPPPGRPGAATDITQRRSGRLSGVRSAEAPSKPSGPGGFESPSDPPEHPTTKLHALWHVMTGSP
jgi:hypothetical protein